MGWEIQDTLYMSWKKLYGTEEERAVLDWGPLASSELGVSEQFLFRADRWKYDAPRSHHLLRCEVLTREVEFCPKC